MLAKPIIGEEVTLYLSISKHAMNGVLVRDEAMAQTPIYYINKASKMQK